MPGLPVFVLALLVAFSAFAETPLTEEQIDELANRLAKITETFEGRGQEVFASGGAWQGSPLGAVVTSDSTPLLANAEEGAQVVRNIPAGAVAPVFESQGEWLKVAYEDSRGWVNISDIKLAPLDETEEIIEALKSQSGEYLAFQTMADRNSQRLVDRVRSTISEINELYEWLSTVPSLNLDGFSIETTPPNISFDFSFPSESK